MQKENGQSAQILERSVGYAHGERSTDALQRELLARMAEDWSDIELLSLVLRTSGKRSGSALDQAQRLWSHFGSLRELARAGLAEIAELEGMTHAKAAAISASFELGQRLACEPISRGQAFASSEDIYRFFGPRLSQYEQETFWALLLDQRHRILRQIQIAMGSVNRCPLMPQDIFAPALREKAVAMVIVHNHPSGEPEPSLEDRSLTRRIQHIAELLGITLLDHVVIGDQRYVSFADRGWL